MTNFSKLDKFDLRSIEMTHNLKRRVIFRSKCTKTSKKEGLFSPYLSSKET